MAGELLTGVIGDGPVVRIFAAGAEIRLECGCVVCTHYGVQNARHYVLRCPACKAERRGVMTCETFDGLARP